MPNRIIKESIRTSKKVNELSHFDFRTWVYLITYADDFGRGSADPELLKGMVFPRLKGVTEQQIEKSLQNLATGGMIDLYEVDGESYFQFPNWSKHQIPRAKNSKFPAPMNAFESTCMQMTANDMDTRTRYSILENDNDTRYSRTNSETNRHAREMSPYMVEKRRGQIKKALEELK